MYTIDFDEFEIELYEEQDFRLVSEIDYDRLLFEYHEIEKLGYIEDTVDNINNLIEEYANDGINMGGTLDRITDGKRFVAILM